MSERDPKRWGSATHEAGHVTAALSLGVAVEHATLHETRFRGKARASICGIIAVAGSVAAREAGCLGHGSMSESDRAMFDGCGLSIAAATLEARRIVRANWRGLCVLADSLYNSPRGEIDGDTARSLFDTARWRAEAAAARGQGVG